MNTNCFTYYSKKGCPPCDFWYQKLAKKYKGCYDKVVLENNEQAIETVNKYGVNSVPFMVFENGEVLSTDKVRNFIRNI